MFFMHLLSPYCCQPEPVALWTGTVIATARRLDRHNLKKPLIRQNGMLIYQQLFNGKIQVLILPPYIEGLGEPRPPKMVGIYRPEEIKDPFIVRHCEEFIRDMTDWEDYDDDEPSKVGYGQSIGFKRPEVEEEN